MKLLQLRVRGTYVTYLTEVRGCVVRRHVWCSDDGEAFIVRARLRERNPEVWNVRLNRSGRVYPDSREVKKWRFLGRFRQ